MINRIVSKWNNFDINEHRAYIENSLPTIIKDTNQDVSTNLEMIRHILNNHVFVNFGIIGMIDIGLTISL